MRRALAVVGSLLWSCTGNVVATDHCTRQLAPPPGDPVPVESGKQVGLAVHVACGAPVAQAPVEFAFDGDPRGATLDPAQALSGADGVAATTLTAGDAGVLSVSARLPEGAPVHFVIAVSAAAAPPVDAGCLGCLPDDAQIVSHTLPASMSCGETRTASVTVRNTGTSPWSRTGDMGYALGYVGDGANPFLPGGMSPRAVVPPGQTVAPGAQITFAFPLQAPAVPGTYPAKAQMLLEHVHWFGATASAQVEVQCAQQDGGCSFPQGVPDGDFTGHTTTDATVADAVNSVMETLSGCSRGSDCYIGDRYPDPQLWFAAVNAQLRAMGYCAGQHEVGSTDEIAVSATGCTGLWYGYHIFYYGGAKVVWNPGAQRGSWSIPSARCP